MSWLEIVSCTVFSARRIVTMNPSQPQATHVAVRDGRILGVGTLASLDLGDDYVLDDRFADRVMMPGFVEGHSHALEGVLWEYCHVGYFDRMDPDGTVWSGLTTVAAVQERLKTYRVGLGEAVPLVAWGFDPIYFSERRLTRFDLDRIDRERPIVVLHASLHMMTVNTAMLERSGLDRQTDIEGILLGDDGTPNGELREMAAMYGVFDALEMDIFAQGSGVKALERYARMARRTGVTTLTDLYNPLSDKGLETMQRVTRDASVPMRLVPALSALTYAADEGVERVLRCRERNHAKLHCGLVKLMTDGSIQGYTARIKWPGYHDGSPNGLWNAAPETLIDLVHRYHQAGLQLHIHTNGDEAVELMLDAIESALELWPRPDHRHVLQHCQIIDHAQMRRAQRLGIGLNMFANHIYYWGDIHFERTLGAERCQRLEPLASADRLGIPIAAHCDAPVTPLSPLFTAWCTVARRTPSGRVLGQHEGLSVERALRLITLDAAWTLRLDDCVGSLEIGKFADMAVLEEDPYDVGVDALPDIKVVATIVGGDVFCNE
ncbi:amidohydrolase [Salinisphaera aquimarina]|uniref:Amidohydrolase n=1 Tax=Salinisphaera aquimarina TaxID=2094031 RepID=A0ABV7ETH1_9GAMM